VKQPSTLLEYSLPFPAAGVIARSLCSKSRIEAAGHYGDFPRNIVLRLGIMDSRRFVCRPKTRALWLA
jgi:hypothetical protein